jgi:bifunctional UDP-N-acetylglucosamine pyrophosphorylase/glucosamine-1-phosphate N-acetyltransferase
LEKNLKLITLSYIGDSLIGKSVNIGAGTITCNYDGVKKSKTKIKDNVFIGSNSSLVAPVTINKKSIVGAGSGNYQKRKRKIFSSNKTKTNGK